MPVFQKIKTSKGEHSLIRADKDFSFLTHPEQTTQFFVVSANSFHIGIPVHFDFSMVESVTDDASERPRN